MTLKHDLQKAAEKIFNECVSRPVFGAYTLRDASIASKYFSSREMADWFVRIVD